MPQEINFSATNRHGDTLHFTLTPYGEEWGWAAFTDATHWDEVCNNHFFDTAAQAQQSALAFASRWEDPDAGYETRADLRLELSPRVL